MFKPEVETREELSPLIDKVFDLCFGEGEGITTPEATKKNIEHIFKFRPERIEYFQDLFSEKNAEQIRLFRVLFSPSSQALEKEIYHFLKEFDFTIFKKISQHASIKAWLLAGENASRTVKDVLAPSKATYLSWAELSLLLTSPLTEDFCKRFCFRDILEINGFFWGKNTERFSLYFLMTFPDFTEMLIYFVQHFSQEVKDVPKNWRDKLLTFEQVMSLIGRAGVSDYQLATMFASELEQQNFSADEEDDEVDFGMDRSTEIKKKKNLMVFRANKTAYQELIARQEILNTTGCWHESWQLTEQQLHQLEFLESSRNPLRHLLVTHGYEIENFTLGSHRDTQYLRNDSSLPENKAVYSEAIFGLLHKLEVIKQGNDLGEISPGPWYVPEHSMLFFQRLVDAGILELFPYVDHSCHFNLGVKTDVGFGALCGILRGTGYVFGALRHPRDGRHKESFEPEILPNCQPNEDGIAAHYYEIKQFRFYSVDSHMHLLNDGVKLAQALRAAEKAAVAEDWFHDFNLKSLSEKEFKNISSRTLKKTITAQRLPKLTSDEKQLAQIWVETFAAFLEAAKVIGAPDLWKLEIPANQEWKFTLHLSHVFPTDFSHISNERVDQTYSPTKYIPFASEITVAGQKYPNFVSFCRQLMSKAAAKVDRVMENSYQTVVVKVDELCTVFQLPESPQRDKLLILLLSQFLQTYSFANIAPYPISSVSEKLFSEDPEYFESYKEYFITLQKDLALCGFAKTASAEEKT